MRESIFYPVKVMDDKGAVKKVISTKTLKERHWERYKDQTKDFRVGRGFDFIFPTQSPHGAPKTDDY